VSAGKRRRLRTLHHIGIVLLRASGIPSECQHHDPPVLRSTLLFPRLVESMIIHLQIFLQYTSMPCMLWYQPIVVPNDFQEMQIQAPRTKFPNTCMAICTLEIRASTFIFRVDVPTSASFVRNQGSAIGVRDSLCKGCIVLN